MRGGLPPKQSEALVLRECRVCDGLGGPAAEGEVWIVSGFVVEPGSVPSSCEQALGGRVVAPGLIDVHVHLCMDAGLDPLGSLRAAGRGRLARLMRANAAMMLRRGVTLCRDLGAPTDLAMRLRGAIASGRAAGPRVLASGAPLTTPRGHLYEMGGEVDGADAIRAALGRLRRARVDVVKAVATGGGSSPQTDPRSCQFSDEDLCLLVREARCHGLTVACHAHSDEGVRQAIGAGVSTIEHGSYASEASLRAMAKQGISLVPTLWPALIVVDESPFPHKRMGEIRARLESRREAVRLALRHGVRLLAGTDAGTSLAHPGRVAAEVVALAECGVPPALALAAAGREAAAVLGVPRAGTLAPGAPADLIVLGGDPLSDLGYLERPLAVMRGGRWAVSPRNAGPGSP